MSPILRISARGGPDSSLERIVGLLRRRCVPVSAISCTRSAEAAGETIHVTLASTDAQMISQAMTHLARLPDVLAVAAAQEPALIQELALLTVSVSHVARMAMLAVTDPAETRLVASTEESVILQVVSRSAQIDALATRLRGFGRVSISRSGAISTDTCAAAAAGDHSVDASAIC